MSKEYLVIGIIIPRFPSYTETFFLSQVTGLCERGYTVYVFCDTENNDPVIESIFQLKKYTSLHVIPLGVKRLSLAALKSLLLHPLVFIKGLKHSGATLKKELYSHLCKIYFKQYKCHVYHFGYSGTAISYLTLLDYLPGKIMVSCLGTAENVKPLSEPERVKKLNSLFNKADKIHCVSAKMQQTIQHLGAVEEKIFINRPAIDIHLFSRIQEYKPSQKIQILSIGRLVFQKGFLIGILAVSVLIKSFSDFSWIIVGEGPELEELIFTIHLLRLDAHIHLAGKKNREEVLALYQTTDIFFLPSVSEGIANVVLEAMSMKIPVIAANSGGMGEVIIHHANGILCSNYNFESMGAELDFLCKNFEKRKLLGQEGRKTIEQGFSLKRYIDVFEEEYHKIIS